MDVTRKLGALALVAALCSSTGGAMAQELVTLKAASSPQDVVTSALYAVKSGMFRRAGLNVEIVPIQSGAAAAAAIVGGSLQTAISSIPSLITAHVHGIPFTLVAPAGLYLSEQPITMLLARKDSTFQTGRDLAGKTVGVLSLSDIFTMANKVWIDSTGGDYRTVKFVEMPNSALLPALEDGRIDAVSLALPTLSEALESGKVRVLGKPYDPMGKRLQTTAWFMTEDFVAKNRDAVARFVRVLRDAAVYSNAHQAETVDVIAAFSGVDAKLIARTPRVVFAEFLEPQAIQPLIDASVKYKLIEKGFNAQEFISPAALRP
jgi:NitT/TauT family transport system substrate-binding protein